MAVNVFPWLDINYKEKYVHDLRKFLVSQVNSSVCTDLKLISSQDKLYIKVHKAVILPLCPLLTSAAEDIPADLEEPLTIIIPEVSFYVLASAVRVLYEGDYFPSPAAEPLEVVNLLRSLGRETDRAWSLELMDTRGNVCSPHSVQGTSSSREEDSSPDEGISSSDEGISSTQSTSSLEPEMEVHTFSSQSMEERGQVPYSPPPQDHHKSSNNVQEPYPDSQQSSQTVQQKLLKLFVSQRPRIRVNSLMRRNQKKMKRFFWNPELYKLFRQKVLKMKNDDESENGNRVKSKKNDEIQRGRGDDHDESKGPKFTDKVNISGSTIAEDDFQRWKRRALETSTEKKKDLGFGESLPINKFKKKDKMSPSRKANTSEVSEDLREYAEMNASSANNTEDGGEMLEPDIEEIIRYFDFDIEALSMVE